MRNSRSVGQLPSSHTVREYLHCFRRHRLLLLMPVLIGTLGGAAVTKLEPPTYLATASVLVTPTGVTDPNPAHNRAPGGVDLDTEIQLVTSEPVIVQAARSLNTPRDQVAEHLSVNVPPNSRVLRLTFSARQTAKAARGANAVAQAYLEQRDTYAKTLLAGKIKRRQAKLDDLQSTLQTATGNAASATSTQEQLYAQSQVQLLIRQIGRATATLQGLHSTVVTPGEILVAAVPPPLGRNERHPRHVLEGLLLGLVLGCLAARLAERRSTRIVDLADLRSALPASAVPVELAGARPGRSDRDLVGVLRSARPDGATIFVTPAGTPTNLSWVPELADRLNQAGCRTVVVTWRRVESVAGAPAARSSPTGQASTTDLAHLITRDENGVDQIDAGLGQVEEFIHAPRPVLRNLLARLREEYDYVLVMHPGQQQHRELIASLSDMVMITAMRGRSTVRDVARACTALGRKKVLAGVLISTHPTIPRPGRRLESATR